MVINPEFYLKKIFDIALQLAIFAGFYLLMSSVFKWPFNWAYFGLGSLWIVVFNGWKIYQEVKKEEEKLLVKRTKTKITLKNGKFEKHKVVK